MSALQDQGRRWRAAWATRSVQERSWLKTGAVVAVLLGALAVLVSLQEARRQLHESTTKEKQRLSAMTAMRTELSQLGSTSVPPPLQGEQLRAEVETIARRALAPATVSATLDTSDRVKLGIRGVAQDRMLLWINTTRRTQRLRLDAIKIIPQAGGLLDAELHFSGTVK